MNPMRIGIDARLHAYRVGGISTYARELTRALQALRHPEQQYIVLQHRRESQPLVAGAEWLQLLTPPHHRWEGWSLGFELATRRLKILHSTDFIPPKWGAKRFVITIHDLAFLRFPQFLTASARRYYNRQIRYAVRKADHILAVSAAAKDDIVQLLDVATDRITVQQHGYGAEFRPYAAAELERARDRWRLPDDYFLFVGTIEPRKNLSALLASYRELRTRISQPPALLLCAPVGWGSEGIIHEIQEIPGVIWWDESPFAALPAVYAGSRALVLPSHYEGFGLPALEAMACGTPPIVSDIPALREVVGDAGWLIDPAEPETIAAAMRQAVEYPERLAQERSAALSRAGHFSWRKSAEIAQGVYEALR